MLRTASALKRIEVRWAPQNAAQARLEANQAVLDVNETDEEGDTFRVGVPKLSSKPRLIP